MRHHNAVIFWRDADGSLKSAATCVIWHYPPQSAEGGHEVGACRVVDAVEEVAAVEYAQLCIARLAAGEDAPEPEVPS